MNILTEYGINVSTLPIDKECVIKKVTGVEPEWYVTIENRDLHTLDQTDLDALVDSLNYDIYLTLLKNCYEDNWKNPISNDTLLETV